MDATPVLAAILRDAAKSPLLRGSETFSDLILRSGR
jgi:hypothetical protein